jgi:hypothetical protein
MFSFVKEFQDALEDVLKSDDDLSNIYLTHKETTGSPRPLLEHTEVEDMLEIYSRRVRSFISCVTGFRLKKF